MPLSAILQVMKTVVLGLVAVLVLASASLAADPIGRVVAVQGAVSAVGADGASRQLELKSPVFLNDKIVTPRAARVQVMFDDDSVISQGEDSEITIDSYMYAPRKKESNCALRAVKGLFRVVTGKVTDLNPDRFKVKTRMATIGIRGCDVGIEALGAREHVYILALPHGRSIVISKTGAGGEDMTQPGAILNILEAGVMVAILEGVDLQKRFYTPAELLRFVEGSSPGASGEEHGISERGEQARQGGRSTADAAHDAAAARNQARHEEDAETQTEFPPLPTDEPTEAPDTTTPTTPRPVLVGGSPLNDYEWSVYEDGSVSYSGNRYSGAAILTASEYQVIAGGANTYNLSGSGDAGAIISHTARGTTRTVSGTCSLDVSVGYGVTPRWGGTFNMNNAGGDSLNFSVSPASGGTITAEGVLQLRSLASYSLVVDGAAYGQGTLTSHSVEGRLIKPGYGSGPISAAGGQFRFGHGSSATVKGAFGADLAGP